MKSILLLLMATSCVVSPVSVTAQTPVLLRTFNNPAPEGGDHFGIGLAALGSDRVLIGAPNYIGNPMTPTNAAAVHLFHTNGTLLTTITKPPAVFGEFGSAITTLGSDQIVISASSGHHVCLFSTNGAPLTIITNQSQPLGPGVVAIGNDKLLIAAPNAFPFPDPEIWVNYGAAFLYSTNGTLLKTFHNPNPAVVNGFGWQVAAFGSDRVLIGSNGDWSGSVGAYLFHTNGMLLMTFTNPTPSLYSFGRRIAAVGTDRVLVSSPADGVNTEEVYMFNTNGTLLLTITNPTPAVDDYFGAGMAVLGNDCVVISAPGDDTTGSYAGSAYVFSINGTLLATINNPEPGTGEGFGTRLAAFGYEGVIIGAPWHQGVGSAYLFSIPAPATPPSLTIQRTMTNTVVVSWPSPSTGFVLQQSANGVSSVNWSNVTAGIQNDGTNKTLIITPAGSRFYRLFKP